MDGLFSLIILYWCNNSRKILRTATWQFGPTNLAAEEFCNPIISKLDKHVVLLPINYIASKNGLFSLLEASLKPTKLL